MKNNHMSRLFYRSLRIGRGGIPFVLYKFRTMKEDGGSPTAAADDPRLTRIGRWLRRLKLDEMPTVWNLLKGDIAIVGPRPDVPGEIESLDGFTRRVILSVKPGLVSPATLWDIDEDERLKGDPDPHRTYCERIKPVKYALNVWYVENRSLWLDVKVIVAVILRFFGLRLRLWPKEICEK